MSRWYDKDEKKTIDYSEAIMCVDRGGRRVELLLPRLGNNSYTIIGYDWFLLAEGKFNSCCNYSTPELAIKSRAYCEIVNYDFEKLTKEYLEEN